MKIFLDTADTQLIKRHQDNGLVDGVTTNPTLIMKSGRDPYVVYNELVLLEVPDISMEVVGNSRQMLAEGLKLHEGFGDRATIKVPCTEEGLYVCKELAHLHINVNVTLIFTVAQAILAAKSGATYVSPFVGRVDDQSFDGIKLIRDIHEVYEKNNVQTQILSASIRSVGHVTDSFLAGADVVTMPPSILEKMYRNILTDKGIEQFDKDWAEVESLRS